MRNWAKQARIDAGVAPGVTAAEVERIKELERDNRELNRRSAAVVPVGGTEWQADLQERVFRR